MTLFGNRLFADIINEVILDLGQGEGLTPMTGVLVRRRKFEQRYTERRRSCKDTQRDIYEECHVVTETETGVMSSTNPRKARDCQQTLKLGRGKERVYLGSQRGMALLMP